MRMVLKRMHDRVIAEAQPKDFDQYINSMKQFQVKVIPCINKQNKLQGFRFEFGSTNLKGSEIHRSMSMGKIAEQIGFDRNVVEKAKTEGAIKLLDRTVNVTPNLAVKIAAKVVKQAIKRTIDKGIGIGIEI